MALLRGTMGTNFFLGFFAMMSETYCAGADVLLVFSAHCLFKQLCSESLAVEAPGIDMVFLAAKGVSEKRYA